MSIKNYNIEEIKPLLLEILKKHDVKRASLFGSIVRGEINEDSDLDLIIEFSGTKSLLDLARLKLDIEEKFKFPVDILTYNSIHPLLREKILSEQVSIL